MPRLNSAASIPVLLWAMPKYERPSTPPLIQAVVNSGVQNPTFKGYLLSPEDRAYLMKHGMPNGSGYAIDETPAPEGFEAVNVG